VPRPALTRTELVEDPVLRHLEEPGRELRAEGELREPLEDAEEDLLCQVLGQRAVAHEPQDIVVDGRLVGTDDEGESPLVTALGLPQNSGIRLLEGHLEGGRV
jgi:hypothetical protein